MKIMSYNIQSCRDYITRKFDPSKIIKVIKDYEPDILGLNEVRSEKLVETSDPSWFNQTKTIADAIGYKYYFFAEAIKLQNVSAKLDDPESVEAFLYYTVEKTLYDPIFDGISYNYSGKPATTVMSVVVNNTDFVKAMNEIEAEIYNKFISIYG